MTTSIVSSRFRSALVVVFLLFSAAALSNSLEDTHRFRVGIYEQDIDVRASLTKPPLPEFEIDFDKLLGLEESSETIFLSYQWRFKEKWSLQASYSKLEESAEKIATKDFNYGGQEYTAGILLDSEFDLDTYLLVANYSFVHDDKKELGVGLGLHMFDINTQITSVVGVEEVAQTRMRTRGDLLAPLPNLRAYGTYMVTPKWEVSLKAGWLSLTYGDYDGSYLFLTLYTEYRVTDRFGIGMSYQAAEIDVSHEDNSGKEKFDMELYGPSIFLTYGF